MPHRAGSRRAGIAGGPSGGAAAVTILLTGAAGFIGYHVAEALLARGERVIGVDNLNAYYDVRLKQARLARLDGKPGFTFHRGGRGRSGGDSWRSSGRTATSTAIVHLAAQAGCGIRWSIRMPMFSRT